MTAETRTTPDAVEADIIRTVDGIIAECPAATWGEWTLRTKRRLGEMAERLGYHPCGDQCRDLKNGNGEFLWDMAWFAYTDDGGMAGLPLVLESEWGDEDHIVYDFEKLLIARAAHKVMIMQGYDPEQHFARLCRLVEVSGIAPDGDRYLLLFFDRAELKLKSRVFVKQAAKAGK